MNAAPIIVGSMALTVIDSTLSKLSTTNNGGRQLPARIIVGGYITTMALLIGAEFNPDIAKGIAVLILAATLTSSANGIVAAVERLI